MELFTWYWAYDKRLLCCVKYGQRSFVFIWLIPTLVAAIVLAVTWSYQFRADQKGL